MSSARLARSSQSWAILKQSLAMISWNWCLHSRLRTFPSVFIFPQNIKLWARWTNKKHFYLPKWKQIANVLTPGWEGEKKRIIKTITQCLHTLSTDLQKDTEIKYVRYLTSIMRIGIAELNRYTLVVSIDSPPLNQQRIERDNQCGSLSYIVNTVTCADTITCVGLVCQSKSYGPKSQTITRVCRYMTKAMTSMVEKREIFIV